MTDSKNQTFVFRSLVIRFLITEKLQVHFETLENLKKYSASKLFECQKQQQVGGNCSHESQDLERTVVRN